MRFLTVVVALLSVTLPAIQHSHAQRGPFSDRTILVTWRDDSTAREASERPTPVMEVAGCRVIWISRIVSGLTVVSLPRGDSEFVAEWMRLDPGVEASVVDSWGEAAAIPNDPSYSIQYQQYTAFRSCLESGWDIHRTSNILMAVLDSGTWYNASDMIPNHRLNPGEAAGDCDDDDGNSVNDDVHGAVFITDPNCYDNSPACAPRSEPLVDAEWHGNHVQSILAAKGNNSVGILVLFGADQCFQFAFWGTLVG